MGKPNFSEDFKRDAVHQIAVRGYAVREVSDRLGGPVAFSCRSGNSFRRPFVRKPRGFSSRGLSVCAADCKSH